MKLHVIPVCLLIMFGAGPNAIRAASDDSLDNRIQDLSESTGYRSPTMRKRQARTTPASPPPGVVKMEVFSLSSSKGIDESTVNVTGTLNLGGGHATNPSKEEARDAADFLSGSGAVSATYSGIESDLDFTLGYEPGGMFYRERAEKLDSSSHKFSFGVNRENELGNKRSASLSNTLSWEGEKRALDVTSLAANIHQVSRLPLPLGLTATHQWRDQRAEPKTARKSADATRCSLEGYMVLFRQNEPDTVGESSEQKTSAAFPEVELSLARTSNQARGAEQDYASWKYKASTKGWIWIVDRLSADADFSLEELNYNNVFEAANRREFARRYETNLKLSWVPKISGGTLSAKWQWERRKAEVGASYVGATYTLQWSRAL